MEKLIYVECSAEHDRSFFAAAVNHALSEHYGANVVSIDDSKRIAWIKYNTEDDPDARYELIAKRRKIEPEVQDPVRQEYEDEGQVYLCAQCPYLEVGDDKRRKLWPCKYAVYGKAHSDCRACERFYRELNQGLIKPLDRKP